MAHARATVTTRDVTQRIKGTIRVVRSHQKATAAERTANARTSAPSKPSLSQRLERAFASVAFAEAGERDTAIRMLRDSN